ncbi:pimeloyl-ACP methyl ester carboxylesterase [Saccharothrix saharensis]|uniref:Pimeloyl-ACP methyl ester carboxylesterase n=1 Tax=Saccharothrix saharensis TaxID=571190 RepID=A0A543JDB7_9PSEU|nr:alpha/beta hydrolase [Saccharothrix saharensis]TQM80837.1 pimeloyl-ACP methyl ester carboxylesterase [Saccharothrix saharensis]
MRRTFAGVVGAVGLVAALAVAPGVAQAAGTGVSWVDCGDGLQCGEVTVPADWGRPRGARVSLGVARLPAQDQATKKGVLFVNLGGPAQQISVLRVAKGAFTDLTRWFDVVVSDPRGFEASAGIACPYPAPLPENLEWASPDRATYERYRTANHRFGVDCGRVAAGPLAGHLDSGQVAHDMDAIRVALGQERLNYYGNSYGTVFAQAYARLFPTRIGRMYLDSVLDHTRRSWTDWLLPRARTMERNMVRFAQWCDADAACALHGRDVLKTWDEVLARAAREPIPAGDRTVNASRIASRTNPAYEEEWAALALAIAEAHAGDATRFAEQPAGGRDPDLSRIAFCADFPYPSDYRVLKSWEDGLRRVTPHIGWVATWPMAYHCAGLPDTGTYPPHRLRVSGLGPVLVASGEHDSTTPPEDARRVVAQLGNARYLPVQGGHALYLSGHPCVREHVHRYLVDGVLPPDGTACGVA